MKSLSNKCVNELRNIAVALGADRNKFYATSKQSIIIHINQLRESRRKDPKFEKLFEDVKAYIADNYEFRAEE